MRKKQKILNLSLSIMLLVGCGGDPAANPMMPPQGMPDAGGMPGAMQPMQPMDPMGAPMDEFGAPMEGAVDEFGEPMEEGFDEEAPEPGDFNPEDTSTSDLDSSASETPGDLDMPAPAPGPPMDGGGEEASEGGGGIMSKVGPILAKVKGAAGPALQAVKGVAGPLIGKLTSVFKGGGDGGEGGGSAAKGVSFGNPNGSGSANLVTVSGQVSVATSGLKKLFNRKPNKEIWVRVELDGFVRESMTNEDGQYSVQFKELNLAAGEKTAKVSLSNLNTQNLSSNPVEIKFSIN